MLLQLGQTVRYQRSFESVHRVSKGLQSNMVPVKCEGQVHEV